MGSGTLGLHSVKCYHNFFGIRDCTGLQVIFIGTGLHKALSPLLNRIGIENGVSELTDLS